MNHFIMGKNQDKLFAGGVGHTERHFIMVEFTEIRVQLHIFQKIMHPAHIPLEGKSQTAVCRIMGDHRPCGRFFCDHRGAVSPLLYHAV